MMINHSQITVMLMVAVLYTGYNSVLFEAQPPWRSWTAQNRVQRLHSLHTRAHARERRPTCIDCCNAMQRSRTRRSACVSQRSNVPRELHIATPSAPCHRIPPPWQSAALFSHPPLSPSLAQTPQSQITLSLQASSSPNLLLSNKCRPPLSLQLAPPVLCSCPSTPSRPSPSSYPPSTKAACLPRWPQSQPKCANGL